MSIAASNFSLVKRRPLAPGLWVITGKYVPSASYTASGEAVTQALLQSVFGITTVEQWIFSPLGTAAGSATFIFFDHVFIAATQVGKIHYFDAMPSHSHDILLTGGQGAGVAVQIDVDSNAGVLGKTAATSRTLAGGASNIQSKNASFAVETGGTNNFSSLHSRFILYGS